MTKPSLSPATKLRQGNVFTPVFDSIHRGSLSGGGLCPGGGSVQGWSLSGGISVHGVSARETPVQLRAGGVHPTGMHSSCNIYCTTDQTW